MKSVAIYISLIFIFSFNVQLNGQATIESNPQIVFKGLEKTKEIYLRSLLTTKEKSSTDLASIQKDLQTFKNLPGISNAHFSLDTINEIPYLYFNIEERKTALPIINFGGIRDNIWFSLGVIENNFRGQGDQVLGYYQNNNGRHSGQLFFKKPRILNSNWGYSATLNKWESVEPAYFTEGTLQYLYNNDGIGLSLIRNFGLRSQLEIGGTFFRESYEKDLTQNGESTHGPDFFSIKKFLTKLILRHDFLDYNYLYVKGFQSTINYQNVYNFDGSGGFNSLSWQSKLFLRPKKNLNIGIRLRLAISTNNDSPFAPFVADSHVNIRGIGNRIDRGTAQAILNIESRYTLFHKKHWSSQFVAFADNGTWRNPGGDLTDIFDSNQFRQFVGIGVRLNYQKVFGATLRIDYGVDIYDTQQRGLVIGLGQYY